MQGELPCHTEEEIYAVQEKELGNGLERFSLTFKNWDSNKCPVAKRMLELKNSGKIEQLVDALDNYDDYEYDYDNLNYGNNNEESRGGIEDSIHYLLGMALLYIFI